MTEGLFNPLAFLERVGDDLYAKAMRFLIQSYPDATWEVTRYPDKKGRLINPYLQTDVGYFVEVTVIVNQIRRSHLQAVLDENGAVIFEGATAHEIQTAIQDCFLICVGLHGLHHQFWSFVQGDEPVNETVVVEPLPEEPPVRQDPSERIDVSATEDNIFILKDVDVVVGAKKPYYRLDLQLGNQIFEVRVPEHMIEEFDRAAFRIEERLAVSARRVHSPHGEITVMQGFKKISA
ncbi:hypothetical protein B1A99_25150 [Cohnella sp. CIP 111063]|uniref:Sak single strand annealing protein n=1 Tax=unclassified Cohnella TaxID=2636738 RepID=UPI000B8C35D2|nr:MULTISPECIES: DUF1071 domain-containing protein [unclassified Cohnella]OXS55067.1 hypothetical protein B1A99_25150 [Cohnella sp. CIP 111063]PRX65202.1 uncharacterized protein DUF1071 [Cohnella sp. SGD-V74]